MIFKIITMSGQEIPIEEEKLLEFIKEAEKGKKLIITRYGIPNVASIDSIVPDKERNESVRYLQQVSQCTREDAEARTLGQSPFAKILGEKMTMLSPQSRTIAQEQAARDQRSGK